MAEKRWGESVVDYPEPFTKIPTLTGPRKPGMLSEEQLRQFFEQGYVVVRDYFQPEELAPCLEAVSELVENLAQKLAAAGKITDLHREEGVYTRLTKLEQDYPGASVLLFKEGKLPQAFMDLWTHERLLNMVEQLIGPEVAGHPVWNLRIKPPVKDPAQDRMTVPWHQDSAYFSEDSYDHMVVTTWIPFLDTHEQNGGMQVVKGGHRKGRVARHTCCVEDTWFVSLSEEDMEKTLDVDVKRDTVMCEVPFGGFLLFNNMTPHRSVPNVSDKVRWSVDLRWQSPKENWGFYNIAAGVPMRSAAEPNISPNWEKFLSINRKEVWQKEYYKEVQKSDPLDTIVTGPWIGRWEIVNENRHTQAFCSALK